MSERHPFDGETLRTLRESRGMTIEDVYRKLRIPQHVIRAFESSRIDDLPEITYAFGFLRTYCDFLEIDSVPFADRLAQLHRPTNARGRARSIEFRKKTWLNEAIGWAAVSAVFALGWLTYALVLQPEAKSTADTVQAGVVDAPSAGPEVTP
jgi:cytoskeletal protein RodZ